MKRGRPNKISDDDIRELHEEGCTNIEMSEILGVKPVTITNRLRELGITKNPRHNRFRKRYSAHDRDTGMFLGAGTVEELSKMLGRSESTLFAYASALRRNHKLMPPVLLQEVTEDQTM